MPDVQGTADQVNRRLAWAAAMVAHRYRSSVASSSRGRGPAGPARGPRRWAVRRTSRAVGPRDRHAVRADGQSGGRAGPWARGSGTRSAPMGSPADEPGRGPRDRHAVRPDGIGGRAAAAATGHRLQTPAVRDEQNKAGPGLDQVDPGCSSAGWATVSGHGGTGTRRRVSTNASRSDPVGTAALGAVAEGRGLRDRAPGWVRDSLGTSGVGSVISRTARRNWVSPLCRNSRRVWSSSSLGSMGAPSVGRATSTSGVMPVVEDARPRLVSATR